MQILKVLVIFFLSFTLFSCENNNKKNEDYKENYKKENHISDINNSERIVLKTLNDIEKINENIRILIINEEFWKNKY